MDYERFEVIEGEIVDAPHVLESAPARATQLVCGTHPAWMGCGMTGRRCVQFSVPVDEPDERTWAERATTFRVVDQRRSTIRGWK